MADEDGSGKNDWKPSISVEEARNELSDEPITAGEFVAKILDQYDHREKYAKGKAADWSPDTYSPGATDRTADEWLTEVKSLFDLERAESLGLDPLELFGRLAIMGLARLDPSLRRNLRQEDILTTLRDEMDREGPTDEDFLTERGRKLESLFRHGQQYDGYGVNDQPTEEDTLGFGDYVDVLSTFLADERTHGPMTVAVEGEWGSGKSSLMRMLKARLDGDESGPWPDGDGSEGSVVTVWFNPWRHDHEEALWAAFMQTFFRQLTPQLTLRQRLRGHMRWYRSDGRWVRPVAAAVLSLFVIGTAFLTWYNPAEVATLLPVTVPLDGKREFFLPIVEQFEVRVAPFVAVGMVVAYVLGFVRYLWEPLTHPVEVALGAFASDPEYENRVSFIERFHEDFGDVLEAYVGEGSVFVFVDDLDRCVLPRAADLMEAINLLTDSGARHADPVTRSRPGLGLFSGLLSRNGTSSGDRVATDGAGPDAAGSRTGTGDRSTDDPAEPVDVGRPDTADDEDTGRVTSGPEVFFVLGMDREKVAAGIAAKHKDLLGYLDSGGLGPSPSRQASGREFGNKYLEKFVQLRVRPPRAGPDELDDFLRKFQERDRSEDESKGPGGPGGPGNGESNGSDKPDTNGSEGPGTEKPPQDNVTENSEPDEISLDGELSPKELESVVRMVAPTLEYNPRQLTTFVNQFRLEVMLAARRGWFNWEEIRDDTDDDPTKHQHDDPTKHQLGKWVAMGMEWPGLVSEFRDDPDVLSRVKDRSYPPGSDGRRFKQLLDATAEDYETTLDGRTVRKLLAIEPATAGLEEVDQGD